MTNKMNNTNLKYLFSTVCFQTYYRGKKLDKLLIEHDAIGYIKNI